MKPRSFKPAYLLVGLLLAGTTLTLVSWGYQQAPGRFYQTHNPADTTPEKKKAPRERTVRDLDEAISELDNLDLKATIDEAMKGAADAMKGIDGDKIRKEIEDAMKDVNIEKIQQEVNNAMKEVDMAKIQREINESVASINWDKMKKELAQVKEIDMSKMQIDMDKIKEEVSNAMKQVDMAKIQREINASVASIDWEKMKTQMDELKHIDMSKLESDMKNLKKEMEKLGPQLEKEMDKAKEQIEKAKAEMKDYKQLVDGLDKDGLLNKKEPYSITHKDGQLIVNDKPVTTEIYNKYRSVLEKHKSFSIKKDEDNIHLNND